MNGILTLVELECCNCIIHFAMDRSLYDRCKENGRTFYCPNGHAQHFIESELEILRRKNASLVKQRDWAEDSARRTKIELAHTHRQKAAIKGQLTKTRKRIANGVCPCCKRTFKQLSRHMENKHPDFKKVYS